MKKITLPDFKVVDVSAGDFIMGGSGGVVLGEQLRKKFMITPTMLLSDIEERVSTLETLSNDPYEEIKEQLAKDTESIGTIYYQLGSINYSLLTKYGVALSYDSDAKTMSLLSSNGTVLSTISVEDFVIDGMINSVSLEADPDGQDEGVYLHFVFNTDAGKEDIYVNVTDLIDIYNGSDSVTVENGDSRTISVNEDWLQDQTEGNVTYTDKYGTGLLVGTITVGEKTYAVYVPYASTSQYGVVEAGNGIAVDDGVISADVSYESSQNEGEVIGTLTVGTTETEIDVQYGTNDQYGITKASTGITSTDDGVWTLDEDYLNDVIDNNATVVDLGERLTQAEADIDSLEGRMDTAEADIDQAEADIDALEARMDTAEEDIDHLETRMTNAETAITTNQANITTNLMNIATLFSQVSDVQSSISEIQSEALSKYGVRLEFDSDSNAITLYATDGTVLSTISVTDLVDIYTAGDGISIDSNVISTDDDYIAGLNTLMTEDELDTMIYTIEGKASYGMAAAMGLS